jgi:hypothetical protein
MGIHPAMKAGRIALMISCLTIWPILVPHQSECSGRGTFPVEQRLVREGTFAVRFLASISKSIVEDEASAEKTLGDMGITPQNGWIANYPVTPDIRGELRNSLTKAVASGKVGLGKDEAPAWFERFCISLNLPPEADPIVIAPGAAAGRDPSPQEIKEYYKSVGPPVVTNYPPPDLYSDNYCLVPYPFSSLGREFSGFYIMKKFHRTLFENNRVEFVSNTLHVFRKHRMFIIDPLARLNGRTYAGIGARGKKRFIPTGIKGSENKIFNGPQPCVTPCPDPLANSRR